MKIGVISDTHGKKYYINSMVEKMGKIDMLIHLGDHCSDAAELGSVLNVPVKCVRGNCDLTRKVPDSLMLTIQNKKIFITHGHLYHVKTGYDRLVYKSKEAGADITLFGHTHMPEIFFESGILFMNPGSASCPHSSKFATIGIISLIDNKIVPYIINLYE